MTNRAEPLQPASDATGVAGFAGPVDRLKALAALALFLIFVSAAWFETDAYRYVGLMLVAWAPLAWLRSTDRISIGWMGAACLAWVACVTIRYLAIYWSASTSSLGSAEGIYLFPIFYAPLGYIMLAYRRVLGPAALLFVLLSFILALASVDVIGSFDGAFHDLFYMNNRIHGSVAGGFIILAAINAAAWYARTERRAWRRWAFEAIAYATIALCVVGLFGAKSKGVWAAIGIALLVQLVLSLRGRIGVRSKASLLLLMAALATFMLVFRHALWSAAGPTLDQLAQVLFDALKSTDPAQSIRTAIDCGFVPRGTYLRLMLWYSAAEVWSHNITFGSGIGWQDLFDKTHYAGTGFNVVHNAYLEIAMRYGAAGLAFFAALFAWTVQVARKAARLGLIAPEVATFHVVAVVFFLVTIVTNSNNRLAIGETYMTLAGAFGFYCQFLCQNRRSQRRAATP